MILLLMVLRRRKQLLGPVSRYGKGHSLKNIKHPDFDSSYAEF